MNKENQYSKKKGRRWKWPECGNEHRQTRPSCNPIPLLYQDCTIKSKNVNINIRMNFEAWIKKRRRRRRRKREMERTCERDSARSGGEIWNEIATVSSPLSFLFFSLSVWIWESEVKKTSLRDQNNIIECLLLLLLLTTLGLWRFSLLFSSTLVGNGSVWLHFYNWVGFAHIHS